MTVLEDGQTFSMVGGSKVCELYERLDLYGKFLYALSVRRAVVAFDNTADSSARGKPINGQVCRTKLQKQAGCDGCRMVIYQQDRLIQEKLDGEK